MRARVARCWCEREALLRDMPSIRETCFICFVCGIGYPVRLCSSDGWVNDLKEEALQGEHVNEDGYWTEEDDETLQLVYLEGRRRLHKNTAYAHLWGFSRPFY